MIRIPRSHSRIEEDFTLISTSCKAEIETHRNDDVLDRYNIQSDKQLRFKENNTESGQM